MKILGKEYHNKFTHLIECTPLWGVMRAQVVVLAAGKWRHPLVQHTPPVSPAWSLSPLGNSDPLITTVLWLK